MAENLSPANVLEDTSWIQPGVTAWTWLNRESTSDPDVYKKYIDFAAEMGWEYLLLDEGWQPRG
ncbi:MAG: glycoside hydrolase family 97 catalytic domain-containing protein, partial [Anaeromassilibacillus sp.]